MYGTDGSVCTSMASGKFEKLLSLMSFFVVE